MHVEDPINCPACGGEVRPPADGRWRWARGSKSYRSMESAQRRADLLNSRLGNHYEYAVARNEKGQVRVCSRLRATVEE